MIPVYICDDEQSVRQKIAKILSEQIMILDQDLGHSVLELADSLSRHASREVQTVDVKRRLFEICLIQVQCFQQDIRAGHLDG